MRTTLFIILCFLFAVIIDMPSQVKIAGRQFYRPQISLNLLGGQFTRDLNFKLGLDLQGGTDLVYQADPSQILQADRDQAMQSTKDNIERRINSLGVSEPLIQTSKVGDQYRLIVELPGVKNVTDAINTIGQTAQLDFRLPNVATPSAAKDFTSTGLTGKDLSLAAVQFNNTGSGGKINSGPGVGLQFSPDGAKKFAQITKANIGRPLAIFLDNQVLTAPTIQTEITDGKAVIDRKSTRLNSSHP
jgi:preprotein translocase subunit SecD